MKNSFLIILFILYLFLSSCANGIEYPYTFSRDGETLELYTSYDDTKELIDTFESKTTLGQVYSSIWDRGIHNGMVKVLTTNGTEGWINANHVHIATVRGHWDIDAISGDSIYVPVSHEISDLASNGSEKSAKLREWLDKFNDDAPLFHGPTWMWLSFGLSLIFFVFILSVYFVDDFWDSLVMEMEDLPLWMPIVGLIILGCAIFVHFVYFTHFRVTQILFCIGESGPHIVDLGHWYLTIPFALIMALIIGVGTVGELIFAAVLTGWILGFQRSSSIRSNSRIADSVDLRMIIGIFNFSLMFVLLLIWHICCKWFPEYADNIIYIGVIIEGIVLLGLGIYCISNKCLLNYFGYMIFFPLLFVSVGMLALSSGVLTILILFTGLGIYSILSTSVGGASSLLSGTKYSDLKNQYGQTVDRIDSDGYSEYGGHHYSNRNGDWNKDF